MTDQQAEQFGAALGSSWAEPKSGFVAELRQLVQDEAASRADSPIIETYDLGEPVMTKLETQPSEGSDTNHGAKWWSSRLNLGLAAAGLLLVVGIGVVGINVLQDNGDPDPTASPTQTFGEESAQATVGAFFDAYNAGDVDAVFSLFTPEVTSIEWFGPESRADFEMITAFYAGQGTTLTTPDCRTREQVTGVSVTIDCTYDTLDGVTQAVDALPVPTTSIMVVTPEGVTTIRFRHSQPDFIHAGEPLHAWNHPDGDQLPEFGDWTSVEEAREVGALYAQHAQEWAVYLEANSCGYLDGC